jgi:hypothetical protein
MAFKDWFIVGRKPPKGTALAAAAGSAEGVFLSAKSLLSFPIASGVVTMLWKLSSHYLKVGDIAVLIISLLVGALIFAISISDSSARPQGFLGWVIAIGIALINSLFLAASSLGLATALLDVPAPPKPN